MSISVYTLADPRTAEIRYVGTTVLSVSQRLATHIRCSRRGQNNHKSAWIRQLLANQLKPVIESVESECADRSREIYWIAYFRSIGASLTNMTDGGDGCTGLPLESRRRIGIATASRKWTPEARARARCSAFGRKRSAETREKIRRAVLGRKLGPVSAQTKRLMRAAKLGHAVSEETRRKIRTTLTGRKTGPRPPEVGRKISATKRRKFAERKAREDRN